MRDKQIDEMTKVIARRSKAFRNPNIAFMTTAEKTAESLYNAGYRKASDVAREIFEEIEQRIGGLEYRANTTRKTVKVEELKAQVNWVLHEVVPNTIAELKKKYESEG